MIAARTIVTGFDPEGPFGGLLLPRAFRDRIKATRFRQEWDLTLEQYRALMAGKPVPSRRRQRGSIILAEHGRAALGGRVVLTPQLFEHFAVLATNQCGVLFKTDGEMAKTENLADVGGPGGEWFSTEPQAGIGSSHEVRSLSVGRIGTWDAFAAADDVWVTINANRHWWVESTFPTNKTTTSIFEVGRDGVESAIDSAAISCTVNYT